MAVDERGRLQLADAAKRVFGDEAGFEVTLEELAREIRTLPWKMMTLTVAFVGVAVVGIRL